MVLVDSARFLRLPAAALGLGGCPRTMRPRHLVLLTPPKSSHPRQLLSRQRPALVSPLAATHMAPPSVANKRLTAGLNPLAATLTKTRGAHPSRQNAFPSPRTS